MIKKILKGTLNLAPAVVAMPACALYWGEPECANELREALEAEKK